MVPKSKSINFWIIICSFGGPVNQIIKINQIPEPSSNSFGRTVKDLVSKKLIPKNKRFENIQKKDWIVLILLILWNIFLSQQQYFLYLINSFSFFMEYFLFLIILKHWYEYPNKVLKLLLNIWLVKLARKIWKNLIYLTFNSFLWFIYNSKFKIKLILLEIFFFFGNLQVCM